MNEDLRKQESPNEEVDLGQLFNAIGRLFERFFRFIGSIFNAIVGVVVFILKVIIDHFKLIFAVMIVAFIVGYSVDKMKPDIYESQMLVKPYFDTKYQLIKNMDYFNSLIAVGNTEKLSSLFEIPQESAAGLKKFIVNPGPESDNEKAKAYGKFLKSIDTASSKIITYKEFIKNRDIYAVELFEISVESTKIDLFKSLEPGLKSALINAYAERLKEKRDAMFAIQKLNIQASLSSIDSLRKVYFEVLKDNSSKGATSISFGEGFSLEPDNKSKAKELELLDTEIEFRNKLAELQEKIIDQDTFFDVVSGFQDVGTKTSKFEEKYAIVFPLLAFVILTIIFMISRTIKFVRGYEV